LLECACALEEAIGQGGFPVVDMGDDGEIPDVIAAHWDRTVILETVGKNSL
jgi:hypothetical protein